MSIFSGLFRSRDKPQNRTAGSSYAFYLGASTSGKRVNEHTAMQMTAVYACVRILAEAIAGLPLHYYRYGENGSKQMAVDDPLYFLLHDEPNPEMTSFLFRETLMTHLLLWGNAYAQVIRNGKGEVIALYPLMPNRMTVDRDENGQLYYSYRVSNDEANTMGEGLVNLRPEDVLHIPGLGFDGLVGYSPIAMAKNTIGMAIACEEYGATFFSTPISISPNEAQFLETRKFQVDEIARIFRIPPHMIGDLDRSTFSNIEQQSLEFVKYTLDPWVTRWEQSMNRRLIKESDKGKCFFKFNVDGLLRGDYQSRMNGYAVGIQNGFLSVNDVRELENFDLISEEEGGNNYMVNGNLVKLKDVGAAYNTAPNIEEMEESEDE